MERTVSKVEVKVRQIIVDCEENDSVDIRCGGPSTLGFNFFVPVKDAEKFVDFIHKTLKKYDRPCMSIRILRSEWMYKNSVWPKKIHSGETFTEEYVKKLIEKCIKKGY